MRSAKLEKADAAELVALEAELAELREKQVEYSSRMEQENSTSGKVAMLQVRAGGLGRQAAVGYFGRLWAQRRCMLPMLG